VAVGGWAIDPDTQAPIDVHVYVGAAGYAVRADGSRPDVGAVYPGYGPAHGFSASLPAAAGPQRVCVYGINTGPGANTLIGCRDVVVPSGSPFGALDLVSAGTGQVRVAGWGIDPDSVSPIDVHVYVDGAGYAFTATGSRPDVAGVYPGYGAAHGFDVVVPSAAGAHRVCAYLINVGVGGNALLGCRDVVVGSASPFGALDAVSAGPGSVAVGGWAIDPNAQEPIDVHVYVGAAGYAVRADGSRPDVGAVYPGYGAAHGFWASLPAAAGPQRVCVYGINTGPGANTLIGCRDVVVPAT